MPTYLDLGFDSFLSRKTPSSGESSFDWKMNIKPGSISFDKVLVSNPLNLAIYTVADLPAPTAFVGPAVGRTFAY